MKKYLYKIFLIIILGGWLAGNSGTDEVLKKTLLQEDHSMNGLSYQNPEASVHWDLINRIVNTPFTFIFQKVNAPGLTELVPRQLLNHLFEVMNIDFRQLSKLFDYTNALFYSAGSFHFVFCCMRN